MKMIIRDQPKRKELFDHYLEFKNNGGKYKSLTLAYYFNGIQSCFKEIKNHFIESNNTWKIQTTLNYQLMSFKYIDGRRDR